MPHGNAGRADGRPGHLHRGPAPPVPALCPGRFELRGDWNDLRCSKYSVRDSIIAVRKIFKDFLKTDPTNDLFSGYQVKGIVSLSQREATADKLPASPIFRSKPMKTINRGGFIPTTA